ncbi:DNA mismatch repair protein MutS domain protein [Clostridium sp. DL-VIII]|uniref:MutS-related protein n=1 Tax=Clostridium sp. DL-VIII TaxID=641107 RepID=UPI00023B0053|nr:DNA mismatch repair protein MutS [Clostridium sp. DL-VIII]EHI99796.1 DNA mismatch repair protein MutS domain protein [Clostridium sp. DL-VIII]
MNINVSRSFIQKDLNADKNKKRDIDKIRTLFDIEAKNEFTLDNQTWDDLIMDEVFYKLDRTYSAEGESVLYTMLRNPLIDEMELKERGKLIDIFKENIDLTVEIRRIFCNMVYDKKNRLIEMMNGIIHVNKSKFFIYSFLGVLPILLIAAAIILKQPDLMMLVMIDIFVQIYIHTKEHENINAIGLIYLRDLISAAKKLSKIENEEIQSYITRIREVLREIKSIDKSTCLISIVNSFDGLFELISIPFLIEEITYYKTNEKLLERKDKILDLYYLVGELDALISIAIYENKNKEKCTSPRFIKETSLKINDGIHPLLKKPVGNSIDIAKNGIVLTGTNMSGKSTFLRMVSTNILLAQTFNFALAKEYEGCLLNIVSSISPKDDIIHGKSYYLAEAEAILRIIKASEKEIPVFCPIDEIFRGTNPLERISSSAEILNYINKGKAICIVATHDRELSEMLKENYDFYYFSEEIDEKNGLKFDYKLKRGISKTRNAIKLLEYVGYPKEILENSYKRIESMEGYI